MLGAFLLLDVKPSRVESTLDSAMPMGLGLPSHGRTLGRVDPSPASVRPMGLAKSKWTLANSGHHRILSKLMVHENNSLLFFFLAY